MIFFCRLKNCLILTALLIYHVVSLGQPVFRIDTEDGRYKGVVVGVFHQGVAANAEVISLLELLTSRGAGLIMEQKPVGGWSLDLAKAVLQLHGLSLAEIMRKEKLACLQKTESEFTKTSPAHASMYSTGPAAYVLMIAQPKAKDLPNGFSLNNVVLEKWLYEKFQLQKNQKIIFLEQHIDVFERLKKFSAYELAKISDDYCNIVEKGLLEKNNAVLNFHRLVNFYVEGDFDGLRAYIFDLSRAVGWSEKLIKSQYDERELDFAEKITNTLRTSKNEHFIITVGAAHIGGSSGLLASMRKRGFKITKCNASDYKSCFAESSANLQ
jgi:uncharacterized protein YbaP (TraB family)